MTRILGAFRRWRRMRRIRSIRSNHPGGHMPMWTEQENNR